MRPMHIYKTRQLKVAFMYNHETSHQVAHTAPILKEILRLYPNYEIDVLTSTHDQEHLVRRCLGLVLSQKINYRSLKSVNEEGHFLKFASKLSPLKRLHTLKKNIDLFRGYDVLVVPEWTSLFLKKRYNLDHLKMIFTHHGAGDRSITYNDNIRDFNYVLLSGQKFERAHLDRNLVRHGDYAVVGYPKFDFVVADDVPTRTCFENDKPVILYNPHFDPYLSSWYTMGESILGFFRKSQDFNLIFAPHIMLFQRKLHTSLEHKIMRWRKNIADRFLDCENILIDLGSAKSIDMTYTRLADVYIGDVSSQVYEFLYERRPCLFLNSHDASWENNPYYAHWSLGPVINSTDNFAAKLSNAIESHHTYKAAQDDAFVTTFDLKEESSSIRAAKAIGEYLDRLSGSDKYFLAAP